MALSDFLIAKKTSDARRDINRYSQKAGRAIGKQSKWGNLGRMIGQAALPKLAAAAIGGPIGIAGAALATGLGSYLGGKWGREAAGKTKGGKTGKVPQGTWLQGSREQVGADVKDMKSMLREQNMSAALTSGVTAGAKAFGDAGGFKALTGTGKPTFDAAGNAIAAPTMKDVLSKESLWGTGVQKGSLVDKFAGEGGFLDRASQAGTKAVQKIDDLGHRAIHGGFVGREAGSSGVYKKGILDIVDDAKDEFGYAKRVAKEKIGDIAGQAKDVVGEGLGRLDEGAQILGSEVIGRGKQYVSAAEAAGEQLHGAIRQTGENVVQSGKALAQDAYAGASEAIYGKAPGQFGGVAKRGLADLGYDVQDLATGGVKAVEQGLGQLHGNLAMGLEDVRGLAERGMMAGQNLYNQAESALTPYSLGVEGQLIGGGWGDVFQQKVLNPVKGAWQKELDWARR